MHGEDTSSISFSRVYTRIATFANVTKHQYFQQECGIDSLSVPEIQGSTETLEEYRGEVARILASKTFATSRQIQDFLRFTCELSIRGRTQIDQAEIACWAGSERGATAA